MAWICVFVCMLPHWNSEIYLGMFLLIIFPQPGTLSLCFVSLRSFIWLLFLILFFPSSICIIGWICILYSSYLLSSSSKLLFLCLLGEFFNLVLYISAVSMVCRTSSSSITRNLLEMQNFTPFQNCWIRISILTRSLNDPCAPENLRSTVLCYKLFSPGSSYSSHCC